MQIDIWLNESAIFQTEQDFTKFTSHNYQYFNKSWKSFRIYSFLQVHNRLNGERKIRYFWQSVLETHVYEYNLNMLK